jgi:pimeloyl-ACP methyl ester carboxylesterase
MKKWLRRFGLAVLVIVLAAVVSGSAYEWFGRRSARRDHPPRGTLVDIGGRRIQLDCRGTGTPTIVLESGLDILGSLSWGSVHDSLAGTTRTCAYSRAGIVWSDRRSDPFTGSGVADDLHAALQAAGERSPFVLAGHSLGGPLILAYTGRFPDQVAGMVMVDASHPDQLERLKPFMSEGEVPAMTAMKVGAALSWSGLVRFLTRNGQGQVAQPEADKRAMESYASTSLGGALREFEGLEVVLREAGQYRQLGDRPLVVLTAMKPLSEEERAGAGMSEAQAAGMKQAWLAMHRDEATWSSRSRHEVLDDASHYIQFDRPDVVIRAVREVVGEVRAQGAARAAVP